MDRRVVHYSSSSGFIEVVWWLSANWDFSRGGRFSRKLKKKNIPSSSHKLRLLGVGEKRRFCCLGVVVARARFSQCSSPYLVRNIFTRAPLELYFAMFFFYWSFLGVETPQTEEEAFLTNCTHALKVQEFILHGGLDCSLNTPTCEVQLWVFAFEVSRKRGRKSRLLKLVTV